MIAAAVLALTIACGGSGGGSNEMGAAVFKTHCQLCHGVDGKLGLNGAKDLSVSALSIDERKNLIRNGKNAMIAYENILSPEEIEAVAKYTMSLKK